MCCLRGPVSSGVHSVFHHDPMVVYAVVVYGFALGRPSSFLYMANIVKESDAHRANVTQTSIPSLATETTIVPGDNGNTISTSSRPDIILPTLHTGTIPTPSTSTPSQGKTYYVTRDFVYEHSCTD
ncbi:uncharacterized protein [Amphiura filiformis]|uniref:uncharacterized protein n=1 Tax=Amphiura filiformis TaxID=82378 RepID=UPI003B212B47